jgi:hypothetical protein
LISFWIILVVNSIREFYADNKEKQVSRKDFEATLKEIQVRTLIGSLGRLLSEKSLILNLQMS